MGPPPILNTDLPPGVGPPGTVMPFQMMGQGMPHGMGGWGPPPMGGNNPPPPPMGPPDLDMPDH